MHYLVATDSVHTTAAACDYLDGRLDGPNTDTVTVITVTGGDDRDAGDAANVARARLAGRATVETLAREGDPGEAIIDAVVEVDADVLVLGPRSGAPGAQPELGSTARSVLARSPVPAVVVPLEQLDPAGVE
ncbi:universal stress protein [Haloglomus litoreum]|uniref:universal stress protein n=1 Tax=Haloglomus litoreum TaxID=3034026 RepID=UPI0023E8D973|nr:universal stress protein [Haloglomus sp. DT116]